MTGRRIVSRTRDRLARALREAEEGCRAFVSHSSDGIWKLEFHSPIDTSLPESDQLELVYRRGRITQCNDAVAHMYHLDTAQNLCGQTLDFMLPSSDPAACAYLTSVIQAGYRATGIVAQKRDAAGHSRQFSHSITGTLENGRLLCLWGTQRDITESAAARQAQAHLAAIVESSDDAIISQDLEGRIQSWNAAAERLFGYSADEAIGRPVRMTIPPECDAEESDILARIRRGERLEHFETVRVSKAGQRIDTSLTISPVRDSSATIIGASTIARDITERKRLATALEAQQAWLRVTLGSIDDAVITSDSDETVTLVNAKAEALTGWSTTAGRGRPLREVFNALDKDTRQPVERGQFAPPPSAGLGPTSVLLVHRDGTERLVANSETLVRDVNGRTLGTALVFRDVSEQRHIEDAAAQQREWFERTLERVGDAVIATDVESRILFMNPVAERLTGWSASASRGRRCAQVFTVVDQQTRRATENPVTTALARGDVVEDHSVLVAVDRTEHPIDESGAPIRDHAGRIVGAVLVFRDATDRRRAEAREHAAALERERLLEAERTARSDANRARRMKDEFVGVVSHELRAPLNAILGWTELMMRSLNDEFLIRRGLDIVARNTRRQARLIGDVLDISRMVSGTLRLELQQVDLESILTDAVHAARPDAEAKGIEMQQQVDSLTSAVSGDPARLQQVVWTLLANAVKFTPHHGHIVISLRAMDGGARLTVADDGVGIPPEFLPYVFEPFSQADQSSTRRFGGLGLGLAIVKQLVELHGGVVRAESAGVNLGSTFTVTLPWATASQPIAGASDDGRAGGPEDVVDLGALRVLLVEDEPDTRESLARLLEGYGARVVVAGSVPEAWAEVSRERPDVLVSDIGLPQVDGYALVQQIREHERREGATGLPAIALTAYARAEDRMRALRAGYQAHLAKPVEPDELVTTVASLMTLVRANPRV
jgi:PAS domain S-box-containing protein